MHPVPRDELDFSAKGAVADLTVTFGGVLLLLAGGFGILQGVAAIGDPDFYAAGTDYLYRLNVTAWGWIHVAIGAVSLPVAVGILMRRSWAYLAGIVIAVLSIVGNFLYLPYFPLWAVIVIAFNGLVIWALSFQRRAD